MELPIVQFPSYVEEMSIDFTHLFDQERQLIHFKQLMTGYVTAEKKTLAHMNGLFTFHPNLLNSCFFIKLTLLFCVFLAGGKLRLQKAME